MDPKYNNNKNLIEKLKEKKSTNDVPSSGNSNSSISRNTMRKYMYYIIIITLIVVVVFFVLSLLVTGKRDYDEIEEVMKKAAVKYYTDNSSSLPKINGGVVEVSAKKLSNLNYMKDLNRYVKKGTCSGKVVVENNDDLYVYIPYLDCGSTYKTTELFREITKEENVVTTGNGLYQNGDNYVFRGDVTNNYVSLKNNLYRIVKVNSNNEVMLVSQDRAFRNSAVWDDRYNIEKNMTSGINDFNLSRIKTTLEFIYEDDGKEAILDDSIREHMVAHNYCIDAKSDEDGINFACSLESSKMKVGLLTVDDYMYASLDNECTYSISKSCQNYNYLANKEFDWWLLNSYSLNSYEVFYVTMRGVIERSRCQSMKKVRPVIYLNSKTMYKSGTGTITDPYLIK